jgi:hypothetical protein
MKRLLNLEKILFGKLWILRHLMQRSIDNFLSYKKKTQSKNYTQEIMAVTSE